MAEAQATAFEGFRKAALAREREAAARYQKLLAGLSADHVGKLVEKSADGIVRDVVQQLTGNDGALMRNVIVHAAALEQTQQRFIVSMDAAVANVDGTAMSMVKVQRIRTAAVSSQHSSPLTRPLGCCVDRLNPQGPSDIHSGDAYARLGVSPATRGLAVFGFYYEHG